MYRSLATILVILFAAAGIAYAEEINPPLTDFTAGTPIFANEVNNNFDDVETAVDDNAADIDTLQSEMDTAETNITANYNLAINAVVVNGSQGNTIATNQNDIDDLQLAPLVFRATDSDSSGTYTNADIEAAFTACTVAAPTGGCIIELLDETYTDVRLEVPFLVREIRSAGDNTILLGPAAISMPDANGNDAYSMLEIRPAQADDRFNHGLWIHGFTVDGNKQNLIAPGGSQDYLITHSHRGIEVNDTSLVKLNGLVIENMHIKNFMNEGIILEQTSNAVVRNNFVENLGCWENRGIIAAGTGTPPNSVGVDGDTRSDDYDLWQPGEGVNQLAPGDMGCGAWGVAQTTTDRGWTAGIPNSGFQPGRLSEGIGIEIGCHSTRTIVENNTVRYVTKLGIQTFCDANNEFNPGVTPEYVKIANNDVSWMGSSGILTLGSNFTIVEGNNIHNITAPWMYANTGKGISCSSLGRYNTFKNNTINNTAGIGLEPSCECGKNITSGGVLGTPSFVCNVVASNNTIINPCSQDLPDFTCHAISLRSGRYPELVSTQSDGMTLHNNKVIRPGAFMSDILFDEGAYTNQTITEDVEIIASGSYAISTGVSGVTVSANTCLAQNLVSAPGVLTTDVVEVSFNGDPTGINGFGPGATDGLAIYAYPRDLVGNGYIGFRLCNMNSSAIETPGALTVNWRVSR